MQYAIRSEGEHDYRYDNDLTWTAGPGIFVINREDYTLAFQAVCSGEFKGKDEFRGRAADDTAINSVFVGGRVSGTWKDRFTAEVGLDVPVHVWNSAVQIVPDYRVRGTLSWAF